MFAQSVPFLHGIPIVFNLPAALIIVVITALLVIGIKESARFNNIMVGIKLTVILLVIFVGWFYIKGDNWGDSFSTFAPFGIGGIGTGAAYVFFAYIGFDAVSTTAQEAINPQRDVPIGIIVSLVLCTFLYIAVTAVLTGMVYYKDINIDAPLADAFTRYGMTKISFVISVGAVSGLTSVLLVLLLSQSRIFWAIAKDGLLPERIFAAVHPRFGTPYISTIIVGACVSITASCFPIEEIAKLVNIGTLLAFCLVSAAVIILRIKDPHHPRAFKCPFVPVIPILGHYFLRIYDDTVRIYNMAQADSMAGNWFDNLRRLWQTSQQTRKEARIDGEAKRVNGGVGQEFFVGAYFNTPYFLCT